MAAVVVAVVVVVKVLVWVGVELLVVEIWTDMVVESSSHDVVT